MKKWSVTDCFLCHQPSVELVCTACQKDLPWRKNPCWSCGQELPGYSNPCGSCLQQPPPWKYSISPWQYQPPITQLIHHIKFSFSPHLADYLGKLLASYVQPFQDMDPVDLIIPVPLHRLRQCTRLYNQANWIARAVGKQLGCAVDTQCLKRKRRTRAQATLKKTAERRNNMKSAFCANNLPQARHIALVDDVSTTGATAMACVQALRQETDAEFSLWCLAGGSCRGRPKTLC